ncbi:aldehyde dehydrogenase family protein [Clostridium sp. MT-14]|uniref:aldehyde dehydrogenase family protein n=1 Tax=Clostridium sp. MT-14 TaxID=3348360 RepID=UPI0035F3C506
MTAKTYLNYINGEWACSSTEKTFNMLNPANQDLVGCAQKSSESDMQKAIDAASRAFENTTWKKNSSLRAKVLLEWASILEEKIEDLAYLYTINNGKRIAEARGELKGSIDSIRYNAGLARNVFGRTIEPAENSYSYIMREPLGVVGIISPWNWPAQLMLREMVPALAAGNTVVFKPASLTAAISMEIIKALSEVKDLPKGVVNAVSGSGKVLGEYMADSKQVGMISFTGSTGVGKRISELSSKTLKKVTLELGGKSPNVVFEDANLDNVIPAVLNAVFLTSGQVCMAGTRLVVQDTVFDEVVEKVKTETEKLKVGNGLEKDTDLGPLVSEEQLKIVMEYIELGKKEGKLITGGNRLKGKEYDKGFFVAPTVFADLDNNSRLIQEEIFGPVLVIQKFHTEKEAIDIANGTKYGLAGAIWTNDLNRALRVANKVEAGTVWLNTYYKLYNQAEFGGYKESGVGRVRGIDGLNEFTQTKNICIDVK